MENGRRRERIQGSTDARPREELPKRFGRNNPQDSNRREDSVQRIR